MALLSQHRESLVLVSLTHAMRRKMKSWLETSKWSQETSYLTQISTLTNLNRTDCYRTKSAKQTSQESSQPQEAWHSQGTHSQPVSDQPMYTAGTKGGTCPIRWLCLTRLTTLAGYQQDSTQDCSLRHPRTYSSHHQVDSKTASRTWRQTVLLTLWPSMETSLLWVAWARSTVEALIRMKAPGSIHCIKGHRVHCCIKRHHSEWMDRSLRRCKGMCPHLSLMEPWSDQFSIQQSLE